MVDDTTKSQIMTQSKGLIFPVTWHEPFGLAITESLYFGCPVFGTPYGSLPELVSGEVGLLSICEQELVEGILNSDSYDSARCNEYARDQFNADVMAAAYVSYYEKVVEGSKANSALGSIVESFKRLPYER